MALTLGAATSDRVDHGSAASLDNLDPFTMMMWLRVTSLTANRRFHEKNAAVNRSFLSGGTGNISVDRGRSGGTAIYVTNDTPLTLNAWQLLAFTFDTGAGAGEVINIYMGDLTTLAVESTYGSTADGSGAISTDAAGNLVVGNRSSTFNRAFPGDIAVVTYVNAVLSLNQIRDWQFRPRQLVNSVLYSHYGFNGTGTQPDWSGNGNSGTVTGATVADHVPLGPAFGFDLGWQGNFAEIAAVGPPLNTLTLMGAGI